MRTVPSRSWAIALLGLCVLGWGNLPLRADEEDDARWREKIGFNPQVHAAVVNSSDADVFARVPYAYYPGANALEVAFDAAAAIKLLPKETPAPAGDLRTVRVHVYPALIAPDVLAKYPFYYAPNGAADPRTAMASASIPLDARGRGHGVLTLPKLPAGNYRVEYEFGGVTLTASKTFRRTYFEWEGCTYGTEHKVYAPFLPVAVKGATVAVVDRVYTVNALGLFDSVVAKGRELLAAPLTLVAELANGQRVTWRPGAVQGKASYPDLAEFACEATSAVGTLQSKVSVEEDGCARVQWTLTPAKHPATVKRMWIEMAVKEGEAPLCHLVGMNSMRHNYAGAVPRGGTITWINQSWRPARFEVQPFTGKAPASYQVWEARNNMHWGGTQWTFAPYVWLGAEERGLAWFGDHTQGYASDGKHSVQRLYIEPGKVVLRIELFQRPVTLDAPRSFEFGLQASPTKPMRPDWRGYTVPGGGGMSVVVFGGFNCADKVPANKDWTLVDKVMEGRQTGKADVAWFTQYAQTHRTVTGNGGARPGELRVIPLEEAKANGQPWLTALLHFAGREASARPGTGTTVYYEEHQTSGNYPEVAEYADEWSDSTFARYRYFDHPLTWGPEIRSANPASYRDFAVFYANEWMKRGIGIYYDNTMPMTDLNRQHFAGRGVNWSSSLWGHRDYYKRVWKRSRELMETHATPLPLHTVGHVTNCQVLPYTTWWDATLGVEQPGQWEPDERPAAEAMQQVIDERTYAIFGGPSKEQPGRALPLPPDYLRAMEMGRMAGLIPHYRHLLRSEDAFGGIGIGFGSTSQGQDPAERAHRLLSDAAMGLVHEIRGGDHTTPATLTLRRQLTDFGYGTPQVKVYNYWDDKPFASIGHRQVKWLAMTREAPLFGLLLLQSYAPDAVTTTVTFPAGKVFVDALTREIIPANARGEITLRLPADYGTRLLLVAKDPQDVALQPTWASTLYLEDFELGGGPDSKIVGTAVRVIDDTAAPGNHLLRLLPAHPAQHGFSGQPPALEREGDYTWTVTFRLPQAPAKAGKQGLLWIGYRQQGNKRYAFNLDCTATADGKVTFSTAAPRLSYDGGKSEPLKTVTVDPAGKALGNPNLGATEWHILRIRVIGTRHLLALDDEVFFAGEDGASLAGGVRVAPGWGLAGDSPVPLVEIDNLRVERAAED